MDVIFVRETDPLNPMGTKSIGEIGLVGIAAALTNSIYHATGERIRDLPIREQAALLSVDRWNTIVMYNAE